MEEYLQPTQYINYQDEVIQDIIADLDLDHLSDIEKAKKLFYYVRDSISYSANIKSIQPDIFIASKTLNKDKSFCIPKALALCALARAVEIPARIHLVDFYNHRLSDKLEQLWGTKVMAPHCYTELYLNDSWVKATPALDKETCERHDFIEIEFDGIHDAIIKSEDKHGRPHAEYVKDHGTFADLPYQKVLEILADTYGPLSSDRMQKIFGSEVTEFILPSS